MHEDVILKKLEEYFPHAQCELHYHTPFQLLVAVVLSAQATDKSVNLAFGTYINKYPSLGPKDIIEMGELKFQKIISSIGLYKNKSKYVYSLSQMIIDNFGGEVPSKREELERLPGVGRKTANVVLHVLYQEPTMPVDTHVLRVSGRLGWVPLSSTPLQAENILMELLSPSQRLKAHHLLIFLGRYLCMARKPACDSCPLTLWCPSCSLSSSCDSIKKRGMG